MRVQRHSQEALPVQTPAGRLEATDYVPIDRVFKTVIPKPPIGVTTRSAVPGGTSLLADIPMVASLIGPISNCVLYTADQAIDFETAAPVSAVAAKLPADSSGIILNLYEPGYGTLHGVGNVVRQGAIPVSPPMEVCHGLPVVRKELAVEFVPALGLGQAK